MKIGDEIHFENEDKWIVTKIWNHKDYFRYELVNLNNATFAELKIEKVTRITKEA